MTLFPLNPLQIFKKMVDEITAQCDNIPALIYNNISTLTLTKAQKRWRLAYFSIHFSNTMLSFGKLPKKLAQVTNPSDHSKPFSSIDQVNLANLVKNKDLELLHTFNGVTGLAKSLHTTLDNSIITHDIEERKITFGSNTYQKPPLKGLVYFTVEAFKDTTIIILLACAVLSLGFGIKEEGAKEGWYEGGSIFVAVILVIIVSAVSNFRQEKQFDKLSKVSSNIKIDVLREGRRQKISVFDVVVGDVVILNIGDQVPADGLFIDGHCLLVDESSDTDFRGFSRQL
ncbi:putative P-type Ca(2+) transporter [Helianthus debilis subsp. tardiflorus]